MSGERPDEFEEARDLLHEVMSELYDDPGEAQARLAEMEAREALGSFEARSHQEAAMPREVGASPARVQSTRKPTHRSIAAVDRAGSVRGSGLALAQVADVDALPLVDGVHRSIVAVDIESSTKRTNPVKGELRRVLYDTLHGALRGAGIRSTHLEPLIDRGDGVLILIRPVDDVPKTVLLGRLIPMLSALIADHNATVARPELRLRVRVVVHGGEVHNDGRGFYGYDLDVACRLLDAPKVKKTLREATSSPLVLVVSDEDLCRNVRHGYVDVGPYTAVVRVRVADRQRRGRIYIPAPINFDSPGAVRPAHGQPLPRHRLPLLHCYGSCRSLPWQLVGVGMPALVGLLGPVLVTASP